MNDNKKVRIAYRCPFCASVITADINKNSLDKPLKLVCIECHKSALEINKTPSGSVELNVPCLMCPHPHPYKISEEMFFVKDIITLPCSFTGLDICFIGDEDLVEDEIDASAAAIRELTENAGEQDDDAKKSADMMVADMNVMREVLFAIGNLDEDKKITCSCGSHAIKAVIDYDCVKIVCKVCGKSTEIPARTRFDANDAIELDKITIQ